MAFIGGFTVASLLVTIACFFGFVKFITDTEVNRCDMTFMYEYPQFVRIETSFDRKFKKYGLYAYSEGILTERARNMHFDGIPILFIPGNCGSYRQVRSLASVALRKSSDSRPGFHFDYFTLNLNQELSGFNGALLKEQSEYAKLAIAQILKLYSRNTKKPQSVVLIGHSMGGVIAHTLLGSDTVPLILTLATPHSRPPVVFDRYVVDYYRKILPKENSSLVAVSGGYNDLMVPPFLTTGPSATELHVSTTTLPKLWLSVDHQCILWCKQLVLAINRALFELVDLNTKQLDTRNDRIRKIFTHHLVRNSGTEIGRKWKKESERSLPTVKFKSDGEWTENLLQSYTVNINGTRNTQWHMIRLLNEPGFEHLTILALNLRVENWIFACTADGIKGKKRFCSSGLHLSELSEIAPSLDIKRRILDLDLRQLKANYTNITHVVIRILPTNEHVTLHVDRFSKLERRFNVFFPNWWNFEKQSVLAETNKRVLFYELLLPQLKSAIQSYYLYVHPTQCSRVYHHATAALDVPWDHRKNYKFFTQMELPESFLVRLHSSGPSNSYDSTNSSFASIKLTLDPNCVYSISISNAPLDVMSQVIRIHLPLLVANTGAVILLTFRTQLGDLVTTGSCSSLFAAINSGIKPYYILTSIKILSRILTLPGLYNVLPKPDWKTIAEEGNDFFILPLILYMCSVGLVWIISVAVISSLFLYESTFHKLTNKFFGKIIGGFAKLSDWFMSVFEKLPCIFSAILVATCFASCGALALFLGCLFYFLKLTHMSQDYAEDLALRVLKRFAFVIKRMWKRSSDSENQVSTATSQSKMPLFDSAYHSTFYFHLTLFFMWCMVTALNAPIVLTWAHNFSYVRILTPDSSLIPGVILSLCAGPLWQMDLPKGRLRWYKSLSNVMGILAIINLLYAALFMYRLAYLLTFAIVLVTLHQLFAPADVESDVGISNENGPCHFNYITKFKDFFNVFKTKIE